MKRTILTLMAVASLITSTASAGIKKGAIVTVSTDSTWFTSGEDLSCWIRDETSLSADALATHLDNLVST